MASPRFRMWARSDGQDENRPKAISLDAKHGPGPGRVYDVRARSANDARRVLALFLADEPDRKADREGWLNWDEARDAVQEVTS
jgi:hypothetical protein